MTFPLSQLPPMLVPPYAQRNSKTMRPVCRTQSRQRRIVRLPRKLLLQRELWKGRGKLKRRGPLKRPRWLVENRRRKRRWLPRYRLKRMKASELLRPRSKMRNLL
ncbi:hypothetical protein K443DRAFT_265220 [Laccaria amethystina LaAM-08-1]|uniref:Uncharacterized protein n=1 Tax=Laccaria amethystina LaAM-08-1 TaxID=1095629 RepID=A0A0C9XN63_9AGAR|nr:hypothetical protein K443DRAFT_265220 [Laccaria amethystina LaAM-08-1]